jgi:hypothetical protein
LTGRQITLNFNHLLSAAPGPAGLDAAGVFVNNGINRTALATNQPGAGLLNTGTSFAPVTLNLSQFAGQQVRLEFVFAANADVQRAEGWYIDDVTISSVATDIAQVGVLSNGTFTPLLFNGPNGNLPNSTAGFVPANLDLSSFRGQQIQVQWIFTADAAANAEGWLVDDVKVHIGIPTTYNVIAGQTLSNIDIGGVQVANAGFDRTAPSGAPLTLTGVISDPDPFNGSNLTSSWSVVSDNGQIVPGGAGPNLSFIPNATGAYTVTFTVIDHDDNNRIYTHSAIINVTLGGDANGDSTVNHLDFDILRANFGGTDMTLEQGDLNGDGTVDFRDFQILERNFGKSAPPAPTTPIAGTAPEVLVPITSAPAPSRGPAPVKRPTASAPPTPATKAATPFRVPAKPSPAPIKTALAKPVTASRAGASAAPIPLPATPRPAFSTARVKSSDILA